MSYVSPNRDDYQNSDAGRAARRQARQEAIAAAKAAEASRNGGLGSDIGHGGAPSAGSSGGGGGGGGGAGGGAAATPALPPPPDLKDYIRGDWRYNDRRNENGRLLEEYDAATNAAQQDTEAAQAQKMGTLHEQLADLGQNNAEDLAGRGLLNSGINFQNQDKINEQGVQQQSIIDQMLTDLIAQRGQGRIQRQSDNTSALNDVVGKITGDYNKQYGNIPH